MLPFQTIGLPPLMLQLVYQLNGKSISHQIPLSNTNEQHPLNGVLLKITQNLLNTHAQQVQISVSASQTITLERVILHTNISVLPDARFYCNGFQSWTLSDEYNASDKLRAVKCFANKFISPFGDYKYHHYSGKKGHLHGWTYGYIRHSNMPNNSITFFGSLNEAKAYTLIQFTAQKENAEVSISSDCKNLTLQAGSQFSALNLIIAQAPEDTAFDTYFSLLHSKTDNQATLVSYPANSPININGTSGWTSWYNYYTHISKDIILQNLHNFSEQQIPISIFQIDDGWQQAVGDWMQVNTKFPDGLQPIAEAIQQKGYLSGLWLAPFICQHQSALFKDHPNYLLRNKAGKPITAAYNFLWRSYMYPLNFYLPQVQDHLKRVFDTILNQWNFDLVKLDFLYAVALHPPEGKTRGEVMYDAMQWLRQTVGDKLILGCGVPLGAAFGNTDFCRIGPDVHLSWDMPLLKWLGSRETVSTINAIKNTIHRRQLNCRAFYNDPDVSILRANNTRLSTQQRYTLFFMNQLFGSLQFISDNIAQYPTETLQLYKSQFPLRQKKIHRVEQQNNVYQIYFSIQNLHYLAFSNLTTKAVTLGIPLFSQQLPPQLRTYFYHNHRQTIITANTSLQLAPFETVCLLAVNIAENGSLAGGNAHLFPCSDVVTLQNKQGVLVLETQKIGKGPNTIWVFSQNLQVTLQDAVLQETLTMPDGQFLKFKIA